MSIERDGWRELGDKRMFVPTDKEPEPGVDTAEFMHWRFAGMIEKALGPEGGTAKTIYYQVTRPLGLSTLDTTDLLKAAKKEGYLK